MSFYRNKFPAATKCTFYIEMTWKYRCYVGSTFILRRAPAVIFALKLLIYFKII